MAANMQIREAYAYIKINGNLKDSPGSFTVNSGDQIEYYCYAVNNGDSGKCYVILNDKKTGDILDFVAGDIANGKTLILDGTFTISNTRNIEFIGSHRAPDYTNVIDSRYGDWGLTIEEATASITFESSPSGVKVYVDGVYKGTT